MAHIKYSGFIAGASGKLNGTVFKNSMPGPVLQNSSVTPSGVSAAINRQRLYMSLARSAWKQLPESSKMVWLNTVYNGLMGYALFIHLALNAQLALYAIPTLPLLNSLPVYRNISSMSIIPSTPLLRVTLGGSVVTGNRGVLYLSKAVSPGRSVDSKGFVFITTHNSTSGTQINCQAAYIARFGQVPQSGQKVFAKVVVVNSLSGIMSPASFLSYIVP